MFTSMLKLWLFLMALKNIIAQKSVPQKQISFTVHLNIKENFINQGKILVEFCYSYDAVEDWSNL